MTRRLCGGEQGNTVSRIEVRPSVDDSQGPPPRSPWRAFLLGALVIVVAVAVVLVIVRIVAFPIFESNSEATRAEATAQAQLAVMRTQQALTPVVTSLPAAAPAPTITLAPVATPAPVGTSAPVATPALTTVAVTAGPTPQAATKTAAATVQATATAIRVAAIPTRGPTPPPELDAEISDAYLHYFEVRSDALYWLDPTGLDDVTADGELMALQKNIDEYRVEGRAVDTKVQHNFLVWNVDGDKADVADRYENSSIYVDATTHEPLPGQVRPTSPDVAPVVSVIYHLRRIDGVWKVIGGTEYE
jgi:hypothetical protein